MFWKSKQNGAEKLPRPKEIPGPLGQHLVVKEGKDPDWVWNLKSVARPAGNKVFYCRVFSQAQTDKAGVQVRDWDSLDLHPELIVWEGCLDKENQTVRQERYVKPASAAS